MTTFNIVEIFESLQGEGYNTGMPAIFIRFAGCNLNCQWCDTNFRQYTKMSLDMILEKIDRFKSKNIIITGGEPTLQKYLTLLLSHLKKRGFFIAIESNGLGEVDQQIDYIALSPKFSYWARYQMIRQHGIDEIRIVVEEKADFYDFCRFIESRFHAKRYYLSPCEKDGKFNILATIQLLGRINEGRTDNKWLLSLQTHKFANID
ncbi:MAG: 7-carboxy-7-deazaguanine synthase QueE [Candidatus Schmidhempelia sp.]|nr:7-carboxy-7-deazaguanine synthase QueE [Candidatus Schmidhempelia sp.]